MKLFNLLNHVPKISSTFYDGLWLAFGQVMQALAMIVGIRLITEFVPPDIYGEVTLLMGIVILGRQLFGFPFLQAALRFYPEALNEGCVALFRNIIRTYLFRTIGFYVIFLILGGYYYSIHYSNTSYLLFPLAAALLSLDVASGLETDLFNAARMHHHFVCVQIVNAWLRPILAIIFVILLGARASSVFTGYLTASFILLSALYILPIKRVGTKTTGDSQSVRLRFQQNIKHYAMPLIPLASVGWISTFGDRYIIGTFLNTEQVGLYAIVYSLMSMPFTMVHRIVERTLRPIYFEAISLGDEKRANKYFRVWIKSVLYICIVGVLIVLFFHNQIANLCLAEKYRKSAHLMPWIALGHLLLATSLVFEEPCFAYKKTKYVLAIRGTGAIFSVIIAIPFIYFYGLLGSAVAVPFYFGIQLIISLYVWKRYGNKDQYERQ